MTFRLGWLHPAHRSVPTIVSRLFRNLPLPLAVLAQQLRILSLALRTYPLPRPKPCQLPPTNTKSRTHSPASRRRSLAGYSIDPTPTAASPFSGKNPCSPIMAKITALVPTRDICSSQEISPVLTPHAGCHSSSWSVQYIQICRNTPRQNHTHNS